jgi:phytoene dehydrogenase-like protein
MGNLSGALADAARRFGAEIRTESEVAQIVVKDGAAAGVTLGSGDEFDSAMVISNADVKNTFLNLVSPIHLEPNFVLQTKNVRFRGACVKINLALDRLPRFRGLQGDGADPHLFGLIQIGDSIDELERAFDDAKYGSYSKRPFLEIAIPSLKDPSLAPAGKHVMSVFMQYAPYHLKEGSWKERREELGDHVVNTIGEYAPNFKDSILHRQVLTPLDLEEIYGLTEGNINHGEMSLDQLFVMRPVPGWARYRTPVKNLYLCGATTHPGGGVTGLPGYNAAREILKDWRDRK